jgi:serine/threonine protein kinase
MNDESQQLSRLLSDQRSRWGRGERVRAEEYVRQHPGLLADAERLLDLVYNEIYLREKAGDNPRLDEYLARFPDLADSLRLQFEIHGAIQEQGSGRMPTLPGYELLTVIGQGGMGLVYKIVRPEMAGKREIRKRFVNEARAIGDLDHPNIVKVYEAGESAAGLFLAMELVEGPSFEQMIQRRGLPIHEAVRIIAAVADGVHHAHERGIIHRDLKPANILIADAQLDFGAPEATVERPAFTDTPPVRASEPTLRIPKIADFGLAKVLRTYVGQRQSSTKQGTLLGTPAYIPPEQMGEVTAQPGPWNDIYSLGAILFAALTGRPPFVEPTFMATLMRARMATEPPALRPLRPDISEELERLCRKCLSKAPADRYTSARVLADELRRLGESLPRLEAGAQSGPVGPVTIVLIPASGGPRAMTSVTAVVGRGDACDIRLTEPDVSRRHCRLVQRSGEVYVEDLGSMLGTRVNGEKVRQQRLNDGDRLQLSSVVFQVRFVPEGSKQP